VEAAQSILKEIPSDTAWKKTAEGLLKWVGEAKHPEARAAVARWLQETHDGNPSPAALVALGRWAVATGAYGQGADVLQKGLPREAPKGDASVPWAEAWSLLGEMLTHLGKRSESLSCYERLLGLEAWGESEKWSAYRAIQAGIETGTVSRVRPFWERLFREPEGSLWRRLAEHLAAEVNGPRQRGERKAS
jgi:tetratricopeptide (TPR) repeat protein